ncbi:MAG TPA: Mrp/NBP35 family ATP-binding protein [Acidimicrobiales bacterium]|jgi:ATP-binding protein involved in chromosome partitioning|nr:Mrp/NBP35 family ATP-binding protein [Acidimicrobiales bacterium]
MSVTEAQVIEALQPVQDPELHKSIVELDMVRAVTITGGEVTVQVALTVAGCPLRTEITRRVTDAVTALDGVDAVHVDLTVMTEEQLSALRAKLGGGGHGHGGQAGHAGHGHGPAKDLPFAEGSKTRVLGISSGKGGVGKSSVTVNLAIALAKRGVEVAVLDADVYGFSVPKMLGLDQRPVVLDDMIVPPVAHGVRCISMGFFAGEDQPVIWRGPMLHKALEQFLTDVYWGEPDFLLVDMPPGTGDVALSMAQFLPRAEVFVVTTPQPAAQRVAQRSALMAEKVHLSVAGVIENMSWFTGDDGKRYEIFGRGGGDVLAEKLGVPLVGRVPLVSELREGGDVGAPITVTEPDSEASRAFDAIAETVAVDLAPKRIYRKELTIR